MGTQRSSEDNSGGLERSGGGQEVGPRRASTGRRVILASHLVFHGYGHWLPNDPRGSGSKVIRNEELEEFGPIHLGRKVEQPSRRELKGFYRRSEGMLAHVPVWFDERLREVIGQAIGRIARERGYTVYACAVCSNHAHAVVRTHRDRADVIWGEMARGTRDDLRGKDLVGREHPVWSQRPYKVFLYTAEEVRQRIEYVRGNPMKEGLTAQEWEFVRVYDG